MNEPFGGFLLDRPILVDAGAGVDGQGQVQRQLRLALEDGDLLRTIVLGNREVVAGETDRQSRRSRRSR